MMQVAISSIDESTIEIQASQRKRLSGKHNNLMFDG